MKEEDALQNWPKISATVPPMPDIPYPKDNGDWTALWSKPIIDSSAWVSPGAVVVGRVRLKAHSSVWYGCVLRGDDSYIEVGEESNVQDGSILHIEPYHPCIIGNRVTLGHRTTVHDSTVEDGAMIGMGATVLGHCVIGEGALIAAGALVLEGTKVPPGTLWVGSPARQLKELKPEQMERIAFAYRHYVNSGAMYLKRFGRKHIDSMMGEGV
jgi:carbonic anhydrase/acetyltransferase-like protein (isoleucine patch superfamily)